MIGSADGVRATHYAREQMAILRQAGRIDDHSVWEILRAELERMFAAGMQAGRDSSVASLATRAGRDSSVASLATRAVLAHARAQGEQCSQALREQGEGGGVPSGYWELVAESVASAWYIGYYAGRGYQR